MRILRSAALSIILLCLCLSLIQCGSDRPAGAAGAFGGSTTSTATAPSTPPSTSSSPPPAPNTTTLDNIQEAAGWLTCGSCGDTGGGGATATYQMTQGITSPSLSGSSAEFSIGGSYPYANAYWYNRHTPPSSGMSSLTYDFDLYIPSGSENAPQAIEFECQQRLNGYVYNFAWQAEYTMNTWRVFNYTTKTWENSGIPLQRFSPGTWHHIIAVYHNDTASHTTYHDSLTVDGNQYPLNIVHAATPTTDLTSEFTNAFQLDLNGVPTAYSVYADKMTVTQVN